MLHNDGGFTLVESLVALVILAITLAGMLQGISLAAKQVIAANEYRGSLNAAQSFTLSSVGEFVIHERIVQRTVALQDVDSDPIELEIVKRQISHENDGRFILNFLSVKVPHQ